MSNFAYFSLWLAAALVVIAFISAAIAKHLRLRELRREQAVKMLDALARYSDWVASQRRSTFFQGEDRETQSPLEVARTIRVGWFPELSTEMVELFVVHNRLIDFLWPQQLLRLKDPEAWLESDHDKRFMELWRQHRYAIHTLADKLQLVAGNQSAEAESESIFPA